LPARAALAVDAVLADRAVNLSSTLRSLRASPAATPPRTFAALELALGAILRFGFVIADGMADRTEDRRNAGAQHASCERAS
jgi:hypothetical protein